MRDRGNATLAGKNVFPGFFDIKPNRGYETQAGNDDSSCHEALPLVSAEKDNGRLPHGVEAAIQVLLLR